MKRSLFLALALIATAWCQPASAQYPGNTSTQDPLDQIESARNKQGPGSIRRAPDAYRAKPGAGRDRFGRVDLSGRRPAGYPSVRDENWNGRFFRGGYDVARRRGRR